MPVDYPYIWRVRTRLPEHKGQRCRVLVRGKMNSCLVEFEDGYRVITSRNYLRKPTATNNKGELNDVSVVETQHELGPLDYDINNSNSRKPYEHKPRNAEVEPGPLLLVR